MGTAEFVQNSFTGGEWSKTAQGRFDLPAYRTAMYASLNGLPLEQGAWTRRPGFLLGAQTNAGQPARVVEYAFQENSPYTLEFTNSTLRAFAGYSLAMTNDAQAVLAISTATPAVVETTTAYGWSTGAVVMFNTLGTSDPLLLNRQFTITVVDGTHFSLADAMTGTAIVGTALQTFTTGNVTQVQNYATPYTGTTWDALQLIPGDGLNGSDGLAIVLHGQYAPQILSVATNPTPVNYATFAIDPAVFEDGPYLNYVSNGAEVTPSAVSGIVDLVLAFATWSPTTAYSKGDYVTAGGVSYQSLLDSNISNPLAVIFTGSSATIAATNTFVAGNEVIFFDSGGTLPVALTAGTVYYVIASGLSSSAFKVSATSGGSAITMAAAGTGTMTVALAPGSNPSYWEVVQPIVAVGPNGFLQTDIGRHIRLSSEPALWNSASTYASGAAVTYGAQTYWTSLTSSNTDNAPGTDTVHWAINPTGATWTWGKITGLLNFISGTISGVAHIGNMTGDGGLAAAFNGTPDQNAASSASVSYNNAFSGTAYVGQNYSGCSPASFGVASVTITPSTDDGFLIFALYPSIGSVAVGVTATAYLYGSNSLPATATNGTLLGSTLIGSLYKAVQNGLTLTLGDAPVTIISNSNTAYSYIWVVINVVQDYNTYGTNGYIELFAAQVQFVNANPSSSNAGMSVEILGPPLLTTNAIRTWQLGLYNGTVGWPTCGTYHEGRLWLSGSVNNRLDASEPNQVWDDVISFSPTEYDGTVTDGNAINYTLNAPSTNTVQWLKPDLQGIIVGTERGEWLVFATTLNAPLSPLNIDAHQVTRMGSSYSPTALPVQTEHTTVFIQRYARKLIEYFTDIFSGKFTAPDLADMASHLSSAANPLVELAYQQNVSPNIWARTGLGNLIGCAYKRDTLMSSQGPTMKGWHRHTLGSSRTVSSLAIGPSPDGTLDTPVIVTTPIVGGADQTHHVCFMNRIFEETDALTSASFLDESIFNTTYTVSGSNLVINGLWPLNGYNCDVFAGGLDCGTYAVTNGQMTVPLVTANALLTSSFVSSFSGAMPIVVGFTYTSQGQLLPAHAPQEAGTRLGPALAKTGRIHNVAVKLVNTLGISFGTEFTDSIGGSSTMKALQLKTNGGEGTQLLAANTMFTGTTWAPLTDPYSLSNKICWQITRPFPATITAIGGTQQTQDQ